MIYFLFRLYIYFKQEKALVHYTVAHDTQATSICNITSLYNKSKRQYSMVNQDFTTKVFVQE